MVDRTYIVIFQAQVNTNSNSIDSLRCVQIDSNEMKAVRSGLHFNSFTSSGVAKGGRPPNPTDKT